MPKGILLTICIVAVFLLVFTIVPWEENMFERQRDKGSLKEPGKPDIALVVDTHSDTLLKTIDSATWLPAYDIGKPTSFQIDIPKLRQGGVDVQYFGAFTSGYYNDGRPNYNKANSRLLALINAFYWTLDRNPEHIGLATTVEDIEYLAGQQKIAAVLSIEGAYSLEQDNGLELLGQYYDLGVRAIALTWNHSNALGEGAARSYMDGARSKGGLTEFGERVVKKMNELGIIIDVSHMAEETFWDVLDITDAPVIASHSAAYGLRNHVRNLKDQQIIALAQAGGVVQVVFYPDFLAYDPDGVTVKNLVDHIDYIVNLVGVEHVGLGSDFDGASMPHDLMDASMLPNISAELSARGYSKADINKILGQNTMRVMKNVWYGNPSAKKSNNDIVIEPSIYMGQAFATDTPVISAHIKSARPLSLRATGLRVIVDGRAYSPDYNEKTQTVSLKLQNPLQEKFHVVTFEALSSHGQAVRETRIFYLE